MKTANLLLTTLLILLTIAPLSAIQIDGWLQIPLTEVVPKIDGEMDAVWNYAGKERLDTYVTDAGSDPGDWLDLWGTFYIMYDATGIYYFFKIYDDMLDVSAANTYEQDSIELYWDMDDSKNDVNTGYDDNDFQWRAVLYQPVLESGTGFAPPEGNAVAWTEIDYGYTCEIFVPTETWPAVPEADLEVGFEIQINDCDNSTRESVLRWFSDSNETWHDPSYMGEAIFRGDEFRTVTNMLDINYNYGYPEIDGEKDEWWDDLPNVGMNTYVDADGETDIEAMTDMYDLDFSAWQGWNDCGFFLFVSIIDDVLSTANANTYEQDSIELYFDGDNSKNDVNTGYDDNDMQCRFVLNANTVEAGTGTAPFHAMVAWKETDLGADCEIYIPAQDIEVYFDLGGDSEIGYEIQVNDDDGNGIREGMARWWSNSNETWHDPGYMGEARFGGGGDYCCKAYSSKSDCPETPSVVKNSERFASTLTLSPNYPNPFNPYTTISFTLEQAQHVNLTVTDTRGQWVATLMNESLSGGNHKLTWNASDLPSGVYIVQLKTPTRIQTRKMTLAK